MNISYVTTMLVSLFPLSLNNLLGASWRGLAWLAALFAFCFLGVHFLMLAIIGWKHQSFHFLKKPSPSDQEHKNTENKAPVQNTQEPIYYIVERKRKPAKSNFSTPKQIRFK